MNSMNKFVLTLRTGDEFTAYREEYACFEAKSKDDLLFDLNIALLEFDSKRYNVQKECNELKIKEDKLRHGAHKKEPDLMAAMKVSQEIDKKMEEIKYFVFQNRKFELDYFYYESSDRSYSRRERILSEVIPQNILPLEEWFVKNQGDFIY